MAGVVPLTRKLLTTAIVCTALTLVTCTAQPEEQTPKDTHCLKGPETRCFTLLNLTSSKASWDEAQITCRDKMAGVLAPLSSEVALQFVLNDVFRGVETGLVWVAGRRVRASYTLFMPDGRLYTGDHAVTTELSTADICGALLMGNVTSRKCDTGIPSFLCDLSDDIFRQSTAANETKCTTLRETIRNCSPSGEVTWYEARLRCQELGGHLTTLPEDFPADDPLYKWIGLRNQPWRWVEAAHTVPLPWGQSPAFVNEEHVGNCLALNMTSSDLVVTSCNVTLPHALCSRSRDANTDCVIAWSLTGVTVGILIAVLVVVLLWRRGIKFTPCQKSSPDGDHVDGNHDNGHRQARRRTSAVVSPYAVVTAIDFARREQGVQRQSSRLGRLWDTFQRTMSRDPPTDSDTSPDVIPVYSVTRRPEVAPRTQLPVAEPTERSLDGAIELLPDNEIGTVRDDLLSDVAAARPMKHAPHDVEKDSPDGHASVDDADISRDGAHARHESAGPRPFSGYDVTENAAYIQSPVRVEVRTLDARPPRRNEP